MLWLFSTPKLGKCLHFTYGSYQSIVQSELFIGTCSTVLIVRAPPFGRALDHTFLLLTYTKV